MGAGKGGRGKTTLAAHLAVEVERAGDGPAWLIDTDKQGTQSLRHERRESDTPQRADVPFVQLIRLENPVTTLARELPVLCIPGRTLCIRRP